MGAGKYSESIIVFDKSVIKVFEICKNILKKLFYNMQYSNKEKAFIVAKNVSADFGPAGVIVIVDIKNEDSNRVKISITSTDLTDVTWNFNRNVKNVNRLIDEVANELN